MGHSRRRGPGLTASLDGLYAFSLRWTGNPRLAAQPAVEAMVGATDPVDQYGLVVRACAAVGRPVRGLSDRLPSRDEPRLLAGLGAVGDEELVVLLLRDVVGLDTDQVAAVLDLARSSVRARLQRGRSALARRLMEG